MRKPLAPAVLLGALVSLVGLALTGCAPGADAQPDAVERDYTLSDEGRTKLLEVGPHPANAAVPVEVFTLYGDGRLVCRTLDRKEQDTEEPVEVWLSSPEVEAIMASVVDAGLVEYHPDDMKERLNGPLVYVFQGTGGGLFVTVGLDSYESPSRVEPEPFVHRTGFSWPGLLQEEYDRRRQAGKLGPDAPDTFVELEATLALQEQLKGMVFGR